MRGGAIQHWSVTNAGSLNVSAAGLTCTITGTPAFSGSFAFVNSDAIVSCASTRLTFSGSATGIRFVVTGNSTVDTAAGASTYFPGDAQGSMGTGGKYLPNAVEFNRNTAQFDKTNTTLANITGLTATLLAGRTYKFTAILYTTSNIASGIKAAIAGTCTATAIIYKSLIDQAGSIVAGGTNRATALATPVADVTAVTVANVTIEGTITVNAAGTLTVQFALNTGVLTASVLVGSIFEVIDITP